VVYLHRFKQEISYESTIEENFARLVDADPRIKSISRGTSIQVFDVDGSSHQYTPDFEVILQNGQHYAIECKPQDLLDAIITSDLEHWHARAVYFRRKDISFCVVTDQDLTENAVQYARTYMPFFNVEINPNVRKTITTMLNEYGAQPVSSLSRKIDKLTNVGIQEAQAILYAMIARQQLVVNPNDLPPDHAVDLPDRTIQPAGMLLGKPMFALLTNLEQQPPKLNVPPLLPDPKKLVEAKFLKTKRGANYLKLFALYSDPSKSLTKQVVEDLSKESDVGGRCIYRFRQALKEAGAPGIIFQDLVPFLYADDLIRHRNQTTLEVATIIEDLATKYYFQKLGTLGRANDIASLHQMVKNACEDEELSPPAYNTVKRYVEKLVQRDPIRAAKLRDGVTKAEKLEARIGSFDVRRYGEVVGIDCSPCDVFAQQTGDVEVTLRTKSQRKKNAIRGNFVTVTDAATRQLIRSQIFEGGVGAVQILEVLRSVFLGDTKIFDDARVLTIPQASGLPQSIRIDSGNEFVNKDVARVLNRLGIEPLPRNAFTKHFGGVEERAIGILSHSHHVLPGTSANSIEKRGDYDAQGNAILNFQTLNQFHQRILERHNNLPAPLQDLTRQQHAQQLIDSGMSGWRPLSQKQREFIIDQMHPEISRSTITEGISMFGLKYSSEQLRPLIVRKTQLKIIYNPDDISEIQAIHPDTGELLALTPKFPKGIKGLISLNTWRDYQRRVREAKKQALRGVQTLQQIAFEVMEDQENREVEMKKQAKKPVWIDEDEDELDDTTDVVEASDIAFEYNPPKARS
jgi:hypothetical protein